MIKTLSDFGKFTENPLSLHRITKERNILTKMKTLTTLYFRQLWRTADKKSWIGKGYILFCLWAIELSLGYGLTYDEQIANLIARLSPAIVAIFSAVAFLPDLFYKFIFTDDKIAMDAFLKSRPISQEKWERFLWLQQLWKTENLQMSVIWAPLIFFVLPFGWAFCLFFLLYLISVFNGIALMELRGGSLYNEQTRKTLKAKENGFVERLTKSSVFALQIKSFLRSKRLKTSTLFLTAYFAIFGYVNTYNSVVGGEVDVQFIGFFFMLFAVAFPSINLGQYAMGIEANYFNGLWTKPLSLKRLLEDKYRLYAVITCCTSLIYVPACLLGWISWLQLIGVLIFGIGFCNSMILINGFKCSPFDIFGKTFFNYQGGGSTFSVRLIIVMLIIMILPVFLWYALSPIWFCLTLSGLGIAGHLLRGKLFDWIMRDFEKNKYKYMEKYQNK